MNNQDMPVTPIRDHKNGHQLRVGDKKCDGETKREKAFWQVFSAMLSSGFSHHSPEELAAEAIKTTDAGFKALESK